MADDVEWICAYCGGRSVVPSMARSCERRHEKEAGLDEDPTDD